MAAALIMQLANELCSVSASFSVLSMSRTPWSKSVSVSSARARAVAKLARLLVPRWPAIGAQAPAPGSLAPLARP